MLAWKEIALFVCSSSYFCVRISSVLDCTPALHCLHEEFAGTAVIRRKKRVVE